MKIPVFELIVSSYIFCLIERLNTIRLYILQVDYARNHWYDYIFPQITIPSNWFTDQCFGPYIKLKLPTHLHDDSTWLGFTVYALYTIEKHRNGFE